MTANSKHTGWTVTEQALPLPRTHYILGLCSTGNYKLGPGYFTFAANAFSMVTTPPVLLGEVNLC
jgi:hypothetical protein